MTELRKLFVVLFAFGSLLAASILTVSCDKKVALAPPPPQPAIVGNRAKEELNDSRNQRSCSQDPAQLPVRL